jgi:uncharacterized membrane protein
MLDPLIIVVLLVLAVPVIAIVALVKTASLRDTLVRLEARVGTLERGLAAGRGPSPPAPAPSAVAPSSAAAAPAPQASAPPQPIASPATRPPAPTSVPATRLRAPASPSQQISFEERFGTRWVVWVGGVALALGGIFLVRYTIEEGLIGPGVRISLGALLALILVAAGEWTRRKENLSGVHGLPSAHIPSILTAAGTTVAYATIYAAYGLYDFLPPGAAFVLLGIVALLTLAAALLHGPALAGLGSIGA